MHPDRSPGLVRSVNLGVARIVAASLVPSTAEHIATSTGRLQGDFRRPPGLQGSCYGLQIAAGANAKCRSVLQFTVANRTRAKAQPS